MDQVMHNITVNSPVTVRELEQAESKLAGHGFYVVVTQAQHRLPPWCQLHAGATYQLHLLTKKNAKLYAEHPTSLLGEGTQLMGCATHLRSSLAGLGDTHVWKGMRMLLDLMSKTGHLDLPMIQYPFRATHLLRRQLPPAVLHDWQQRFSHSNGRICIIYEHDILTVIKEERAKKQEDMNVDQGDQYTTENELRFAHLESGLSELKQQNGHFMQWFQQTGDRLKQTESMMQEVQDNVNQHAGAIQQLTGSVQNTEKAIVQTPSKPDKEYGVYKQFRGIRACLPGTIVERARERLARFTAARQVRKTADLARHRPGQALVFMLLDKAFEFLY
ncbi:unnamed protein product, partial [Cladocopium goreaui]